MQEEHAQYTELPRLRARLAEARAAGRREEAGRLQSTITNLSTVAKRDAATVVRERDEAKERLLLLVERIREIQGSVSEVPGGRAGRQARIREYTAQARREKSRYEELNAKVRRFRWYLSGTERSEQRQGAREPGRATARPVPTRGLQAEPIPEDLPAEAEDPKPRRRWLLILAIIAGVLLVVAAALLITSV